jgi:hypothetical protein
MQVQKTDGVTNTELKNELHKLLVKINDYIQRQDGQYLADILDAKLFDKYGRDLVEDVAFEMVCSCSDCRVPELSRKFTELYHFFNNRYFDGQLPTYAVAVYYSLSYFETSEVDRKNRVINILVSSEPVMVFRLLAEMARVATTDSYSQEWKAEVRRLSDAGAPLLLDHTMIGLSAEEFINTPHPLAKRAEQPGQFGTEG